MKKIWKLLTAHLKADFDIVLYGVIAVFLILSVYLNYHFNIENGIIDRDTGKPIRVLWYFILYGSGYFVTTFLVLAWRGKLDSLRSGRFWFIALAGLFILSLNVGFPYNRQITNFITQDVPQLYRWVFGLVNNLSNFLVTALPLFVIAKFYERKRENFGINREHVDLSPYWQLLLIVLPLVVLASFEDGFRNYYPNYRKYEVTAATNPTSLPLWFFALFYEIPYGMDFFNVEFMFRGLLVIGVSQVLGKEAILPMVVTYCFLHFGKPLGECVSSIFGGYILGVVAYYTRNIWGGVIVHVGLAWMMEIAAFLQRSHAINS